MHASQTLLTRQNHLLQTIIRHTGPLVEAPWPESPRPRCTAGCRDPLEDARVLLDGDLLLLTSTFRAKPEFRSNLPVCFPRIDCRCDFATGLSSEVSAQVDAHTFPLKFACPELCNYAVTCSVWLQSCLCTCAVRNDIHHFTPSPLFTTRILILEASFMFEIQELDPFA